MSSASNVPSSSSAAAEGGGGPCGACKFFRRKCVAECIFAPYFDSEQGAAHFAAVHKVFGASNVSKLLLHIPVHKRLDAVVTVCYEAQARLRNPVYGCVSHIFALQRQVMNLQTKLSYLQAHLATLEHPNPPPQTSSLLIPPSLSISDLPIMYDLSSPFDPILHTPIWTQHQCQELDSCHFPIITARAPLDAASDGGINDDLQELVCELLNRYEHSN